MTPKRGLIQSYEAVVQEYSDPATVQRYRRATAGEGIDHLLSTTYGPIFLAAVHAALGETGTTALRALEFGCGAGMAIHYVAERALQDGIELDLAVGADFVPAMIEAARLDLDEYGTPEARNHVRYVRATNERLADELAEGLRTSPLKLNGTFHLALGVNTFRYSIRNGTAGETVAQLERLLAPGGRIVMLDMSDRFPYGLKPHRRMPDDSPARFPLRFGTQPIPSLQEYAKPFQAAGFEIVRGDYLAWIPHSASGLPFRLTVALSRVLERIAPTRAMRALVVARKPV